MAAMELLRNCETRYCSFYIDSDDEIEKLPTSKRGGKGELSQTSTCRASSVARDEEGNRYVLNGDDRWVRYTTSGAGGSGQGGDFDIEIATDKEVEDMLDDVFA